MRSRLVIGLAALLVAVLWAPTAHAATQHFSLSAASYETGGRVMLGMDPGTTRF